MNSIGSKIKTLYGIHHSATIILQHFQQTSSIRWIIRDLDFIQDVFFNFDHDL